MRLLRDNGPMPKRRDLKPAKPTSDKVFLSHAKGSTTRARNVRAKIDRATADVDLWRSQERAGSGEVVEHQDDETSPAG